MKADTEIDPSDSSGSSEETKKARSGPRPIKTQVHELRIQDFQTTINSQGTIRPHNEITLNAEVAGRIIELNPNFDDGAFFNKGDVLIRLDPADYQASVITAEAQLARMTAACDMESAQAAQARENWERFNTGEPPDELVRRLPQLREAEANVKAASAGLERAKRNLEPNPWTKRSTLWESRKKLLLGFKNSATRLKGFPFSSWAMWQKRKSPSDARLLDLWLYSSSSTLCLRSRLNPWFSLFSF